MFLNHIKPHFDAIFHFPMLVVRTLSPLGDHLRIRYTRGPKGNAISWWLYLLFLFLNLVTTSFNVNLLCILLFSKCNIYIKITPSQTIL